MRPAGGDDGGLERRDFLILCGRSAATLAGASVLGLGAGCGTTPARAQDPPAADPAPAGPVAYAPKDYSALRGLRGITDEQLEVHLQLYQGYVTRTNALQDDLRALREAGTFDNTYQELKRRVGFEWDGMRLHELYFDNLKEDAEPLAEDAPFAVAVAATWGSVAAWKAELMGTAKLPGIGWAICTKDPVTGALGNAWVDDHEKGHLAGTTPLLVLDVWEHAFSAYLKPTERAKYLDDFFANVDWSAVAQRLA